jgi:YidC/Oxa1 family membrane protein insertase
MDQRLFLAIALSMLVLIGYYMLFPAPTPQHPKTPPPVAAPGETATPAATRPAAPQAAVASAPAPAPAAGTAAAPAAAPAAAAGIAPAQGRIVHVDTPLYEADLDTRGAVLTMFRLKRYRVAKENITWGDLFPPLIRWTNGLPFIKGWLDKPHIDPNADENMAPAPQIGVPPLALRFVGEDSLTRQAEGIVYAANAESVIVARGDDAGRTLELKGSTADGLTVIKRLSFHPGDYIVDYTVDVANYGSAPRPMRMASLFGEGPQGAHEVAAFRSHTGPIWRAEGKLKTEDPDDVAPRFDVPNPEWVGVTDTYFITVAQAKSPIHQAFYESREVPHGEGKLWVAGYGIELPEVALEPGKMVSSQFRLYLGPKRVSEMEKFGSKLEGSLDLTLDILAQPMLAMMRWFHSFTGNYGVSIILLTIVVRMVLFPLTYRGMLSIKRMQKLQPRMVALREKFKNDKERLNKETMAMYRKYKMNPIGGCLPIALQIPIFFALYSALLGAIELRHEPFMFWITDLSARDGLYITPLLMGCSMLLQQRMTPTTVDPTQAKIMMWMPVIFTFFMLRFPSGLTVYWLTSNLLSVAQQAIINRIKVPEPQD